VMEICAVDHLLLADGRTNGDRARVDAQVADAPIGSETQTSDDG